MIRNVTWAPPAAAQAAPGPRPRRQGRRAGAAGRRASTSRSRRSPTCPPCAGAAMGGRAFSRDPQRVATRDQGRDRRLAGRRRRADRQALPRPRRRDRQHRPRLGDDRRRRAHCRGPRAVQGGDRGQGAADHELARASTRGSTRDRIASQSPAILKDLLRDQLATRASSSPTRSRPRRCARPAPTEQIAVRSIRAGNDIVLTTGQGSWIRTYRALLAEARASRAFRALVKAAAARVLALQRTLC